ncbi:MAG: hypothetical protein M3440_09625 [Chloroflexota bacterium]|nr:hypothetical protein [Chloroflexota bacterium]
MVTNEAASDWRWPLWGLAAGVSGAIGHIFTQPTLTREQRGSGVDVIGELDRAPYHIGVVAGLFAVFCLLAFASGWRRWATTTAPASLAAGLVTLALVASAGAMILGYGIRGTLAIYLPGGINEGSFPPEGLYVLYMFDDLGPFMAWYGVTMAAAAVVWLSLRERQLPKWIGVASLLLALPPVGMLVVTGLSGFAGIAQPLWLIVVSIGMVVAFRRSPARVPGPSFAVSGD